MFEVDSLEQIARLNAAYVLIEPVEGELMWVATDRGAVEAADFKVEPIAGRTHDPGVNEWHREIRVDTLDQVQTLTRLFTDGEVHRYDQRQRGAAIKDSLLAGHLNVERALKFAGEVTSGHLVELILARKLKLQST
jgi:hypothetical protein